MADEEKKVESGKEVDDMTPDYLAAIKELKEKSVDRSKYEELKAENKKLLESIVNGEELEKEAKPKEDIQDLRNDLFKENSGLTNLEYAEKALELRSRLIAEGKTDPFVPIGSQYTPTELDIATAKRVADILQECVDYAEGDDIVFTNELQRRMIDTKY